MRTAATILPGLQPARLVMQNWLDEFLYMKKSVEWGVLTYTMHPYVIGRGYRMLALEDLVDRLIKEGAQFATMEEAAREAVNHRRNRGRRLYAGQITQHGFYLRALKLDEEIPAGKTIEVTVTPQVAGSFTTICDHFCGSGHGNMNMTIVVE